MVMVGGMLEKEMVAAIVMEAIRMLSDSDLGGEQGQCAMVVKKRCDSGGERWWLGVEGASLDNVNDGQDEELIEVGKQCIDGKDIRIIQMKYTGEACK
ncbi:hypothetical protein LguiA_017974 [Lonicera macranthoides]